MGIMPPFLSTLRAFERIKRQQRGKSFKNIKCRRMRYEQGYLQVAGGRGRWALQGRPRSAEGALPPPVGRTSYIPALLQSTKKELFWPTKAFESPAPLEVTLLASEEALGMAL